MRGARDAEVMAESVAYTVTNHFGFDTGVRSFPYVALWAQDVKVLKSNLETIRKVATEMIEGIEQVSHLAETLVKIHPEYDKLPYARPVPKEIIVYKTTIEKHYLSDEDIHPGSIRVVKPEEDILVYLACVKGDTWEPGTTTCSPNPSVYKTIVPRTPKYLAEVNEWKDYGVKVTYKESVGVEPQVDEEDEELAEVVRALEKAEVVNA